MEDVKVTVASLKSVLIDPQQNLERVRGACEQAARDGARLLVLPELMLTGHGGHPKMIESAEAVPDGPLSRAMLDLSQQMDLCICVGIAERDRQIVYNSMMVVDRGRYLGLQRKVHMSSDEYLWFGVGEKVAIFDIGEVRFGVVICFDNQFPELALACGLQGADLILAPHAARVGVWPDEPDPAFRKKTIEGFQDAWQRVHAVRAVDHNAFVLLCNAVGSSVEGLAELDGYGAVGPGGIDVRNVIANHPGTLMGVDPTGEVFLRSDVDDFENGFVDEIVTVELNAARREVNHPPTRNRRPGTTLGLLSDATLDPS